MLSKIFEKCVSFQLVHYIECNNTLNSFQSGFRRGQGTQTILAKLSDDIRFSMPKELYTFFVIFDFTKTFDRLKHELLLLKLQKYGFSEQALKWFESYLDSKRQSVLGSGGKSEWRSVKNGVPQGLFLRPLLFIIYLNDLFLKINSISNPVYADNLQIYLKFSFENFDGALLILNSYIEEIFRWRSDHHLTVNLIKIQSMVLGTNFMLNKIANILLLHLESSRGRIDIVSRAKNLGIVFDNNLRWTSHLNNVSKKIEQALYHLRLFEHYTDQELRAHLILTLIFPHLDYGAPPPGELNGSQDSVLQKLMISCVRYVFDLRRFTRITKFRLSLGWLSARNRRLYVSTSLLHKILVTGKSDYLPDHFKYSSKTYISRNICPQIHIPFTTTPFFDSFSISTSRFCNSLPSEVKFDLSDNGLTLKSLANFNTCLKKFLTEKKTEESNCF